MRIMVLHGRRNGQAELASAPALLAQLPYAKRLELEARSVEDRHASLAALALARTALFLVTGEVHRLQRLRFPQGGKPHVEGAPDFSVSHTTQRVGCAVALCGAVGFDVEELVAGRSREDLMRWTAIEAVLKAACRGLRSAHDVELDAGLRYARIAGSEYRLRSVAIDEDCIAHAALAGDGELAVMSVDVGTCLFDAALQRTPVTTTMQSRSAAAASHPTIR
jgi:hypothetical protein